MKYTIYLRRNNVNGKCYVGQTNNFKQRQWDWNCLKHRYANKHIDKDREKYGFDAWTVEVLAETDSREDAWNLEQRFIKDYNTIWPNGYNLAKGGAGSNGLKLSEEHKQKISEALKGENHTKYWLGKQRSDETKQKLSEANPKKQVYQYTLDDKLVKIWPSLSECGRNGFNKRNISLCCNGKRNKHKGYKWSYKPL